MKLLKRAILTMSLGAGRRQRVNSRRSTIIAGARWRTQAAVAVAAAALFLSAPVANAGHYLDWDDPINAEQPSGTSSELNTPYLDGCPIQSPNGLRLYMASTRPGGVGGIDIWVAERDSTSATWGAPVNLGEPVNSTADDFCPTPVRGGLFFVSTRVGECGGADIYFSRRISSGTWAAPENVGCEVNSVAGEASPSYVTAGKRTRLFFSSNRSGGFDADPEGTTPDSDIYVSLKQADGSFGPAKLVPGVNTGVEDARPNVRGDGREIVFDSNREGALGGFDIYSAKRRSIWVRWRTPVNLGAPINSPANETRASLSRDGLTMYFGSNRAGSEPDPTTGAPSNDIYFTTRERCHD